MGNQNTALLDENIECMRKWEVQFSVASEVLIDYDDGHTEQAVDFNSRQRI